MDYECTPCLKTCYGVILLLIFLPFVSGCIEGSIDHSTGINSSVPQTTISSLDTISPQATDTPVLSQTISQYPLVLDGEEITMIIHSVERVTSLENFTPRSGNVFIVVDATIKNTQESREFNFIDDRMYLREGGKDGRSLPITERLPGGVANPLIGGVIAPGGEMRGEIVFGASEATVEFTLFLTDERGNPILSTDLPIAGLAKDTTHDDELASPGSQNINVTVHSAIKTTKIRSSSSRSGFMFIVVNITIENLAENASYPINEQTIFITGGGPLNQKMYGILTNPLYWGLIPAGSARTGEVVFGVSESIGSFTLTFLDDNGRVIQTRDLGAVPQRVYASAPEQPTRSEHEDFATVVERLNTPVKAAQYANDMFTFTYHDGCISYPPEEFFRLREGDCKDYATFLSYVLAHHGYDAQIVAFSYYTDGKRHGHVVTLFTDTDGTMKYATTPDVSIFWNVSSVEDLLSKECSRLDAPSIAQHRVLPAGSVDCCVT